MRRWLVVALLALAACKSKAQKQAELAVTDVASLEKLIKERHVDPLPTALPDAAAQLSAPFDDAGAKFEKIRDKTDALRSAKRSFFAIVDQDGEIAWLDEPTWKSAKGRQMRETFPPVKDALDGKAFARGSGRFGGDPDGVLFMCDAAAIKGGGALLAVWEAHDAAEDLESAILTLNGMPAASKHAKIDPNAMKKALAGADVWVALYKGKEVYFQDDAYQPLEEAGKALDLAGKTANGSWTGTFDVMNTTWGASAAKIPNLGDDVGVVVMRHLD